MQTIFQIHVGYYILYSNEFVSISNKTRESTRLSVDDRALIHQMQEDMPDRCVHFIVCGVWQCIEAGSKYMYHSMLHTKRLASDRFGVVGPRDS
jgi:hypothetical protein